jgi:hypothetical protein
MATNIIENVTTTLSEDEGREIKPLTNNVKTSLDCVECDAAKYALSELSSDVQMPASRVLSATDCTPYLNKYNACIAGGTGSYEGETCAYWLAKYQACIG